MTTPSLLSRLTGLVRRQPAPPPDVLDPYAAAVFPLADRAEALYHRWFEHAVLVSDSEKLANAAAIQRWEAATIARSLERITPPAELEPDHVRLVEAVRLTSRASQLLSSGSRYHNANALCEGQMLLTEARTRRLRALTQLRHFVDERLPAGGAPPASDAPPVAAETAPTPSGSAASTGATPPTGGPGAPPTDADTPLRPEC